LKLSIISSSIAHDLLVKYGDFILTRQKNYAGKRETSIKTKDGVKSFSYDRTYDNDGFIKNRYLDNSITAYEYEKDNFGRIISIKEYSRRLDSNKTELISKATISYNSNRIIYFSEENNHSQEFILKNGEIRKFIRKNGRYAGYLLQVNFYNKEGKIIESKFTNSSVNLHTYYEYDEYGRLVSEKDLVNKSSKFYTYEKNQKFETHNKRDGSTSKYRTVDLEFQGGIKEMSYKTKNNIEFLFFEIIYRDKEKKESYSLKKWNEDGSLNYEETIIVE